MTTTVYSKPACVQCTSTYRMLDKKGLSYQTVDMTQDEDALGVMKGLGFQQAPVIVNRDEDGNIVSSWSGFNPEKIAELAQETVAS